MRPKDSTRRYREVMDIEEAASYLGVSTDSLYIYASKRDVPAFKLGNLWKFSKTALDEWMLLQSGMARHLERFRK